MSTNPKHACTVDRPENSQASKISTFHIQMTFTFSLDIELMFIYLFSSSHDSHLYGIVLL